MEFVHSLRPVLQRHPYSYRTSDGAHPMILKLLRDDTRGAALVEFTVTLPFFLLLTFGLIQAGLLLWTQAGLQHGVEVATRCASVNYSANQIGLNTSCFACPVAMCTERPSPNDIIKQYAIDHSFGLVPSFNNFTVTPTPPPVPVSARTNYRLCGHRERPVQFDKLYFLGDTHRYIQISDQLQLSRVDRLASARQTGPASAAKCAD